MKYVIDEAVAEKMNLNLPQMLLLMFIKSGSDIRWVIGELLEKGAIVQIGTPPNRYIVTEKWSDLCDNVLLMSDKSVPTDAELASIAEKLIKVFPEGKKPGTPYPWQCNPKDIQIRLKKFFKLYGNQFSEEQIISAARRYVDSFNGDYRYMRLLKYFIWKKEDGDEMSELATYIATEGQEGSDYGESWVNELK